jgi:hypothetical protein
MLEPNFVSPILFSNESNFGRQGCYNAHDWHISAEENPRAFCSWRFSVNLWAGLLEDRMVPMSTESINLDNVIHPL